MIDYDDACPEEPLCRHCRDSGMIGSSPCICDAGCEQIYGQIERARLAEIEAAEERGARRARMAMVQHRLLIWARGQR